MEKRIYDALYSIIKRERTSKIFAKISNEQLKRCGMCCITIDHESPDNRYIISMTCRDDEILVEHGDQKRSYVMYHSIDYNKRAKLWKFFRYYKSKDIDVYRN